MSYIGRNIKWYRKQKQISQTEFANIFSITRASVGAYEEERSEPKMDMVIRFANYFEVSLDDFITKDLTYVKKNQKISTTTYQDLFIDDENEPVQKVEALETNYRKEEPTEIQKNIRNILFSTNGINYTSFEYPKIALYEITDAICVLNPLIERDSDLIISDGAHLHLKKIAEFGVYNGLFLISEGDHLQLIKGEYNHQSLNKTVYKVLYFTDTIQSIL